MTFRITPQNSLDVIRNLVDEVERLKRQIGTVNQNTIRLGNWVLEAEADELVKMTNLVTGAVSYVGANAESTTVVESGEGAYVEIPPFSLGGLLRNAFGSVNMRTNTYIMPVDFSVTTLSSTLVNLSSSGPTFALYNNGVAVYTSPALSANEMTVTVDLAFVEGDILYVEVTNDGDGFNAGLSVMLRQ